MFNFFKKQNTKNLIKKLNEVSTKNLFYKSVTINSHKYIVTSMYVGETNEKEESLLEANGYIMAKTELSKSKKTMSVFYYKTLNDLEIDLKALMI